MRNADGFADLSIPHTYSESVVSATPLAIASPSTVTQSDDNTIALPLPFTFNFWGIDYSGTAYLNMNGFLRFQNGTPGSPWFPPSYPNGTYTNTLAINHTDMSPNNGGLITYGTNGVSPNRVFIIQYDTVPFYSGSGTASFQLQLHETTNEIRIITTNFNPSFGTRRTDLGVSSNISARSLG